MLKALDAGFSLREIIGRVDVEKRIVIVGPFNRMKADTMRKSL